MKSISVIIVSYHTGPALWLAIDSVLAQPECKELMLVDNGNAPGDIHRLRELAAKEPRMKLLTGHGNVGFAKGCNLGAKAARGDYVLLLNPDCMLPEGGLARALAALASYPENTLAGCYLIYPGGTEQRGGRRALLTPESAVVESLGLHRIFKRFQRLNFHETPMPAAPHEVPAISGAFMLISRAFYRQMNGLDEGYFLHMEDMDFCYRVHAAGGKVLCIPDVKVIHFRSTSEAPSAVVERHKARGFIRYLRTHFKDKHSSLFLNAMAVGIWARYILKLCINIIDRLFVPPLAARREVARIVLLYRLTRFAPKDNSLAGKTILVTGASGQVGLCVVAKALARGARVIAVTHKTRIPFTHPNLEWVHCNLAEVGSTFDTIKADALIHTAALWLLPDALPKLLKTGVGRVIAFGSTSVFGKSDSKNIHEQKVVKDLEIAESDVLRIATEGVCHATILRPTMIYGVGLDANISRLADVIRRFGIIPVYGKAGGWRHPVQAIDLADAALNIIDKPRTYGKTYNLGGNQTMTYRTMVSMIFDYLGKPVRLMQLPFLPQILDALGMVYQMGHINGDMVRRMNHDLIFDIKDAIDDFGYRPQGFLKGEIVL